ncbi:pectinesterase [Musa troglodytarum]|uniref:Pectinesterase n=1 Tax=Musa troglodytarum TaxID=320322 RepID=A0A9E7GGC6_9LILI|nr:pectinesterase [Musa troglodytarum]
MICSSTDYQQACESSMSKVVTSDTDDPKVLLKAAVTVVLDEVSKAFAHSKLLKSNDSRVRGAVEDCQQLYENSKAEINATLQSIVASGIDHLPSRSHDMRTWLSAVMTYQQTCIDGFPEGEVKTKMHEAMKSSKEMTSNALAMIGQASSFLSLINLPGSNRRLLSNGYPSWVGEDDRRMLKEHFRVKLTPNVIVAKDGSGKYKTISEALAAMPKKRKGRYVIYIKEGVYEETVNVTKKMANVTMYGDGSTRTIVTGSKNYIDGTRTFQTATFVAMGDRFVAMAMAFRNTAGAAKHQAVALRVVSDRSVFVNCRMEAYQDTLYAHTNRQFYRGCIIAGTVDFIFGDASAVFQNCLLVVRRPLPNQQNIITAQGRLNRRETTGFVLHQCRIKADNRLKSYLARPWKEFSRTIIMESQIDGFIHPEGYMPWEGDFALNTLFYGEYNNHGPGANASGRVTWPGVHAIKKEEAERYTVENFIQGSSWIPATGSLVRLGLGS